MSRQFDAAESANQCLIHGVTTRTLELAKLNKAITRRNGRIARMKERIKQLWWHQAFCCWCDNRALDEPHEELERRLKLPTRTCWLCQSCATELFEALDSMVRQHCYSEDVGGVLLYDTACLSANCDAMELLIKGKRMVQDGERVGRRMFAKFLD